MAASADIMARLMLDKVDFSSKIKEAQTEAKGLGETAKSLAEPLAHMFTVGGIIEFAKHMGETAEKLLDTKELTGINTDNLQAMSRVAFQTGSSLDKLSESLVNLLRTQGLALNGNAKAIKAFSDLGISIKEVAESSPEQLFDRIAVKLTEDGFSAETFAASTKILGEGITELKDTIVAVGEAKGMKQLADDTKGLFTTLTPENLARWKEFLQQFRGNGGGAGTALGNMVGEAIAEFQKAVTGIALNLQGFGIKDSQAVIRYEYEGGKEKQLAEIDALNKRMARQETLRRTEAEQAAETRQKENEAMEKDAAAVANNIANMRKKALEEDTKARIKAADEVAKAEKKHIEDQDREVREDERRRLQREEQIANVHARAREQIRDVFTRGPRADDLSVGASLGSSLSTADARRIGLARADVQQRAAEAESLRIARQLAQDVSDIKRKLPQQTPAAR